jgi:hypothetical protein
MMVRRLAVAIALFGPVTAGAQIVTEQADVQVEATVQAVPLNIDIAGLTSFGIITNHGHEEFIDPTAPGPMQSTAAITISTSPSTLLTVHLGQCPAHLLLGDAVNEMTFYSAFAFNSNGDVQSESNNILLECASSFMYEPYASGASPDLRYLYMWLGGRLVVAPGQVPGLYQGTVTIVVEVL